MDWEIKAVILLSLVVSLVLLAAATALAYGGVEVMADVQYSHESAALLLSGSLLIGLAGALRRLPF
jgi:hypothetical protein